MSNKNNARRDVRAIQTGKGKRTRFDGAASFLTIDCTTGRWNRQAKFDVTAVLMEGAQNSLTARELAQIFGVDTRAISKAVSEARRGGVPIISSTSGKNPGYYLSEAERARQVEDLRRRAREIEATADGLESGGGFYGI